MTKKAWNTLSIIGLIIALLDFIFMLVYFDKPKYVLTSDLGITLLSILFVCVTFLIFDRVREQVTHGVNFKTFVVTALIMFGMYVFTKLV